jgi:hypothetical protein
VTRLGWFHVATRWSPLNHRNRCGPVECVCTGQIRWINDRLLGLEKVHWLGILFDFILLNAVWMHVAPAIRRRSFCKLVTLLKPGAWMAISFRQPEPNNPRSMFPCHLDELEQLARIHGTFIKRVETASDELARHWNRVHACDHPVAGRLNRRFAGYSSYHFERLQILDLQTCPAPSACPDRRVFAGLTRSVNEE